MSNVDTITPEADIIGTPDVSESMGIVQIAIDRSVEAVRSVSASEVMALGFIAVGTHQALGRNSRLAERGFGVAQVLLGAAFGRRS